MNLPLETAIACATINPARSLKIDDEYGSLEKGKKANVVLLEPDLTLKCVIKDGKQDLKEDINHQRKEIF